MSSEAQVKMQAKTPVTPGPARAVQPPQVVPARQATRPAIATQLQSASHLGHSLSDIRLDRSASPDIQSVSETRQENRTGLPDQLKVGVENLSGLSLNNVKVHYNSPKPAEFQALAYTQGTEIHVAPGQERHLPHEAWHVVQQGQGRVQPTMQLKGGVLVNDEEKLEHEADVMGGETLQIARSNQVATRRERSHSFPIIQRKVSFDGKVWRSDKIAGEYYPTEEAAKRAEIDAYRKEMAAFRSRIREVDLPENYPRASYNNIAKGAPRPTVKKPRPSPKNANIGVTFRTDDRGRAHEMHDKAGVSSINKLLPSGRAGVAAQTLPQGASGQETPARTYTPGDLNDIDALYIPGAPAAVESQVAADRSTAKETDKDYQRVEMTNEEVQKIIAQLKEITASETKLTKDIEALEAKNDGKGPDTRKEKGALQTAKNNLKALSAQKTSLTKAVRRSLEHHSRSDYELRLLREARLRGIPILAVCAGSWRLLESFGGVVETLPENERAIHRNTDNPWSISHDVSLVGGTLLDSVIKKDPAEEKEKGKEEGKKKPDRRIQNVNTTHWAAAKESATGELAKRPAQNLDPNDVLEVSARASIHKDDGHETSSPGTVEGFSSKHGAPVMGIQWHPESYLPGMPGHNPEGDSANNSASGIFKAFAQSADSYRNKKAVLAQIRKERQPQGSEPPETLISSPGKKMKQKESNIYPTDRGIPGLASTVEPIERLRQRLAEIRNFPPAERQRGRVMLDQLIEHVDWQVAEMEPDPSERAIFASDYQPNPKYPQMRDANVDAYNMWLFFRELMDLRDNY